MRPLKHPRSDAEASFKTVQHFDRDGISYAKGDLLVVALSAGDDLHLGDGGIG